MLRVNLIGRKHDSIKKKSETCEDQLRRMCRDIAEEITECPQDKLDGIKASEFMNDVYDIEWITFNDHSYKAARLLVAGGGPVTYGSTTQDGTVDGYWGTDKVHWHYTDNMGLG